LEINLSKKVNRASVGLITRMSEDLSLKDKVFRSFLQDSNLGPEEMAKKLGAKYNSVKDAFARLAKEGLLERSSRGNYEPSYAGIVLHLLDRLEALEKQVK
jgi:Mn-dependent DtxR family transcriptional regulator